MDTTGGFSGASRHSSRTRAETTVGGGETTGGTAIPKAPMKDPYLQLLKVLTSDHYAVEGNRFTFNSQDLLRIAARAQRIFQKESALVRCPAPVVIVGDIHGQFGDLCRVFCLFSKDARPGWLTQRYLFLGDYIDRGKQSLEVITCVFILKIRFPEQFFLLRGNHECRAINKSYGFYKEVLNRYGENDGELLFDAFNNVFTHMPLAAVVGEKILCMHGGISPRLSSLADIEAIPKPLADPNSNDLACDLLWADPMIGLAGFKKNAVRGVSVHFGEDALEATMKKLGIKLVVRGHQMMMNGYNFFAGHRLVTIFSASTYYPEREVHNRGAVAVVASDGRIGMRILVTKDGGRTQFTSDHNLAIALEQGYERYSGVESKECAEPAPEMRRKNTE